MDLVISRTLYNFHERLYKFLNNDPRHYQILFQSLFLIYGMLTLGWETNIYKYASIFTTCILTQLLFNRLAGLGHSAVKSAIISGMGICLMLQSNHIATVIIAAFLSISSKYIFRIKGKHIFNPSNFGIVLSLLLTNDAWLTPGRWGSNAILLFFIGAMGYSVVLTVKRLDTALSFLISYSLLFYIYQVIYQGWEHDVFLHTFSAGTLLVFTFFMITDPVSTPSAKKARIVWSCMVGIVAFLLQSQLFITGAPILALFILSPLTPLIDKFWKGENFKWKNT